MDRISELGKQLIKEAASSETGAIDVMSLLGNIHIQIGSSIAHEIESSDEYGLNDLKNALRQLESLNFVKSFGEMPKSYHITDSGKKYANTI
jgi:hypothetical protein